MKNLIRAGLALFVLVLPGIVRGQAASWIKSYGADTDGRENAESAVFAEVLAEGRRAGRLATTMPRAQ